MFNSSFLNIETPKKRFLHQLEVTPVKLNQMNERFAPSYSVRSVLKQLERVHNFKYHEPVEFQKVEELGLTRKSGEYISAFMKTAEIPETIGNMEQYAMAENYWDDDIKEYVSEEFDNQEENSFAIIAVFHYMKAFGIDHEKALEELFSLSSKKSLCAKCVTGPEGTADRQKAADFYNFSLLQTSLFRSSEQDGLGLDSDDSVTDPIFNDDECEVSSDNSVISETVEKHTKKETVFNPFVSPTKCVFDFSEEDSNVVFNPFLASEDSNSDLDGFSPAMNSTVTDRKDMSDFLPARLSLDKVLKSPNVNCQLCPKKFGNRYNMKLHLIR